MMILTLNRGSNHGFFAANITLACSCRRYKNKKSLSSSFGVFKCMSLAYVGLVNEGFEV